MANTTIPNLLSATSLTGSEQLEVVQSGVSVKTTTGALASLNTTTGTVTSIATNAPIQGGTITTTGTISLQVGGVSNTYLAPMAPYTIKGNNTAGTVSPQDLSAAAVLAMIGAGTVTSVNTGAGLTGGPITTSGTISLIPSGVSSGTYGSASTVPVISIDTYGRVTLALNATISIPSGQVTGLGTMATQNANSVAITGGAINGTIIGGSTPAAATFTALTATGTTNLSTIASGTWNGTAIGIGYGGTGATTASTARANLGAAASGANSDITSLSGLTTPLSAPQGGTGFGSYTTGDILYADTSSTLARLNDVATGNALISGGVGVAPSWGKIDLSTHITGTLGTANGGTGLTLFTSGGAMYATSTSALTTGTLPVTAGGTGVTTSTGTGSVVLSTSPTLVTPILGTPTSVTLTNATGLPISAGTTGTLGTTRGGTGLTAFTSGGALYATSTSVLTSGTLPVTAGGTGVTTSTGTGSTVRSTSPALVTPNLGTPSTAILTNATGLPLTTGVTGILPVANGGTGAATLSGYLFGNGTGAVTASATIPNAGLTNSSITLGTTTVSLGATSLTLSGLTTVTVTQDPTSALQLSTKQYVDGQVAAVSNTTYHTAVSYATTADLGTVTYSNGTGGVGATITNAGAQAALTIDGYTFTATDVTNATRVLVKDQSSGLQNGIYIVTNQGSVLTNWQLQRSTDFNTVGTGPNFIETGAGVFITSGTTWGSTSWVMNTTGTINVGTTALVWVQTSSAGNFTVSAPITKTGNVIGLSTVGIAFGGTGQTTQAAAFNALSPITTAGDLILGNGANSATRLGIGTANQILTSNGTTASWVSGINGTVGATTPSTGAFTYVSANGSLASASATGAYSYGSLAYTDTNIFANYVNSVNSYNQIVLQNTNSGTLASTDFVVSNNLGTSSAYYGDFGMNSSGFTGTGALNTANNVFLTATSVDLAIGTTTNNAIRFVVNNGATDALTIGTSGAITTGVWNGSTIGTGYGGTGLTTFTAANNAIYSTSASALTAGTLPVLAGGTGVTTSTGSGSNVLSNSPTLVTPALGTPSAAVLTNATGLPLTTGVTGTLGVTNGGTGTATQFTQGSVVFAGASGVYSQNNSRFFWDNTNNRLGINTASPQTQLTILSNTQTTTPTAALPAGTDLYIVGANAANTRITQDAYGTGNYPVYTGRQARGTAALPTASQSGDFLAQFTGRGYGATAFSAASTGYFSVSAAENFTDTAQGTYASIFTTATGATSATEAFRFGPAGQLGIAGATYGTSGYALVSGGASAAPTWSQISLTAGVTGTLPATNGGTGQSSYTTGDILYASSSSALSKLAAVAIGNVLISQGVGVAPAYGQVNLASMVTGTLPVSNGGTGQASALTQYGVVYGSTTSAMATTSAGTTGQILIANTGGAPTWSSSIPSTAGVTSITFGTTGLTPSSASTGAVTVAGTLVAANGGTGQSSYTIGDLLFASTTTALSKLAAVATGSVLVSQGTGTAPAYSATPSVTSITAPTHLGGTTASSTLTLQSTSGVGTTDSIVMKVGNNGAVTALSIASGGTVTIGTLSLTNALGVASGGTGLSSTPANGALDIGNGTGFTRTTLTAGSGISITNGSGSITIASSGVTSFSAGTTGLTPNTATTGAITLAGTLGTANGGTGLTGFTAANNAIYSTSSSALTAGTLPIAAGGTGITSFGTGVQTALGQAVTGSGGIVLATSPTIATPTVTTSATIPLVIGGTGTGSTLTLQSTSGVGATDAIAFKVGNNGAVTAATIGTTGTININTTGVAAKLYVNGNAAANIYALTDGATITPDFSLGNNFSVTLGGNRTLANPTNLTVGQSGVIYVSQDATGSRTLSYGTNWKFPSGTAPTLTTTANAVDALFYVVRTSTSITVNSVLNIG